MEITHHELGPVRSIVTERFGQYLFELASGQILTVEAEQWLGYCNDESVQVTKWAVMVTIQDVSSRPAKLGWFLRLLRTRQHVGR